MRAIILLASMMPLSAQTLVTIAGTGFHDAAGHAVTGKCTATPSNIASPPWMVAPVPIPFTVFGGAYEVSLLPGGYSTNCSVYYGTQTVSIAMTWTVPSGGPYRIDQVVVTSPSGQQYTVLAQQLASGGSDGQVLTKDSTQPTGQKWAAGGGGGSGVTWNGVNVTWGI